jgi:DNA polymerase I-like protein with 3'-5' exonuclease and polymerase domains
MELDRYCVVDFETVQDKRNLGLSVYHRDFRVSSAAFRTFGGKEHFTRDYADIKNCLEYFATHGYAFVVYNMGFDCNIMRHVYGIADAFEISVDAWRLFSYCNMLVNNKYAKNKKERDTSLSGAVKYLFKVDDYKAEHLQYFIDQGLAKNMKEAHAMVGSLPEEKLKVYNIADVYWTEKVYLECLRRLNEWEIQWEYDYKAYAHEASLYAKSFCAGITVDLEQLKASIAQLTEEISVAEVEVRNDPKIIEAELLLNKPKGKLTKPLVRKWKKAMGYELSYILSEAEGEAVLEWKRQLDWTPFNFRSSKQKTFLFIDLLGLPIERLTKGGKPEISKKTLHAYGPLGTKLLKLLLKMKELDECQRIYDLSKDDGFLHPMLRSGTTVSGRSSSKMG